jgi:hypothetical protein
MQARRVAIVVSALGSLGLAASAWAGGGSNIQTDYYKDMSREELKADMKKLEAGVGAQKCSFCHNRDYSQDTDTKKIARNMINMREKINKDLFTKAILGITEGDVPQATCYMCHRGKEKPEYSPQDKDGQDKEKKFQDAVKADKLKKVKAGMQKVVDKLNTKDYFTKDALGIAKGDLPKATCWMCHRGELEFSTKAPGDGDK